MRRVELIRAFRLVTETLQQSGLPGALLAVLRAPADGEAKYRLLAALREYTLRASQYGPTERRLARVLDLHKLDDPIWWTQAVGQGAAGRAPAEIAAMAQTLRFAMSHLPKLTELLTDEAMQRRAAPTLPAPADGMSHLEVLVIEGGQNRSAPTRLVTALEGISLLYEAVATMQRLPINTLSVIACDSGTDKSFDFLGATPAIRAVKDVLLSVWDRIVVARERQPDERLALIEQSLPALNRIGALRERALIGPEEAELLRRRVVLGIRKFLEAGCTIPEIDEREFEQARVLLAPSPRLLANPARNMAPAADATAAQRSRTSAASAR